MDPLLKAVLRKGIPVAEIKVAAAEAAIRPEWMHMLFEALQGNNDMDDDGKRKAAWVLHHVFLLDHRALYPHHKVIMECLDKTYDPSVLRELLKILGSPIWADIESNSDRNTLFELGIGLLHDTNLPGAIHYAAVNLIGFRFQGANGLNESLEAMQQLAATTTAKQAPLRNCLQRASERFHQNFARTKSPN